MIDVTRLKQSLRDAFRGFGRVFRQEQNFRVHLLVGIVIIVVAIVLPLSRMERLFLVFLVTSIVVLELLNSALELLVDILKPRLHEHVGQVKDILAAMVAAAAFGAAFIGGAIFLPYLLNLFSTW